MLPPSHSRLICTHILNGNRTFLSSFDHWLGLLAHLGVASI